MFCPKCGKTLQEGIPCSCGAPVLSSNPAVNIIKTVGSSKVFLIAAILHAIVTLAYLIVVLISAAAPDVFTQTIFGSMNVNVNPAFSEMKPDIRVVRSAFALISSIPSVLISVSLWITYISSRSRRSGRVSTVGMTICKVLVFIPLVWMILYALLFVLAIIILGVALFFMPKDAWSYSANSPWIVTEVIAKDPRILIVFLGVFFLLFLGIIAFLLFYLISIIRTIDSIKRTAAAGYPDTKVSALVIVMMYILYGFAALGGIVLLFFNPVFAFIYLCLPVSYLLLAVALGQYKKKITLLASSMPGMPPYGAQPFQGYQPPQGYQSSQPGNETPSHEENNGL